MADDLVPVDAEAFVRTAFETAVPTVKTAVKRAEKEIEVLVNAVGEYCRGGKKFSQCSRMPVADARQKLTTVLNRLTALKKKLKESHEDVHNSFRNLNQRITLLKSGSSTVDDAASANGSSSGTDDGGSGRPSGDEDVTMRDSGGEQLVWTPSMRLHRVICDYLLRKGFFGTARKLAERSGIQNFVDFAMFSSSHSIVLALRKHVLKDGLDWCAENRSRLKKTSSTFEFELRLQEFVEMVRAGNRKSAVLYARQYFPEFADHHMTQIQHAMTVLVLNIRRLPIRYRYLFSDSRWEYLVDCFHSDHFKLHCISRSPVLHILLACGMSVLKTPNCYDPDLRSVHCPVCTKHLNPLAQQVPFSHHEHSVLVCRVTGELMNEHNPALVLPNNQLFCERAMVENASKNDGHVICPITGDRFPFSELRKAFIL